MSLPLPPQIQPTPTGQMPGGQIVGGPPSVLQSGGMIAADVLKGIGQFVRDFRATQQQEKDQAKQEFDQMMQQLGAGMPLDLKKVAKKAQQAGIPFDVKGPSKEQIDYQHQKAAIEQQNRQIAEAQVMTSQPGLMGAATQAMPQMPIPQPPPEPPQAKPSVWQQISQGLGWSQPPVSPMSPGMMYLQAAQQAGRAGMDIRQMMQNAEGKTQLIRMMAMNGDPKAIEMYTRLGGMKEISGELEQLKQAARLTGQPDSKAGEMLLDSVSGRPAQRLAMMKAAWEQAQKDTETRLKVTDQAQKFVEQVPGLPQGVAFQYALGAATGNSELFAPALKIIQAYQSKPELERKDKDFEKNMNLLGKYVDMEKLNLEKFKVPQDVAQGWSGLEKQQQRINLEKTKIDSEIVSALRGHLGAEFDRDYRIITSKEIKDTYAKDAALTRLVDAANGMGKFKVKDTSGKEIGVDLSKVGKEEFSSILGLRTWGDPWSTVNLKNPKPDMAAPTQSPAWIQEMMGRPNVPTTPDPRAVEQWRQRQGMPTQAPTLPPVPGNPMNDWIQQMMQRPQ